MQSIIISIWQRESSTSVLRVSATTSSRRTSLKSSPVRFGSYVNRPSRRARIKNQPNSSPSLAPHCSQEKKKNSLGDKAQWRGGLECKHNYPRRQPLHESLHQLPVPIHGTLCMWISFTVELSFFSLFPEFLVAMNVGSVQFALGWIVFTIVIWEFEMRSSRARDGLGGWDGMGWSGGGWVMYLTNPVAASNRDVWRGWADMQDTLWTQ